MKKILLFGAGKSATALISFLVRQVQTEGWFLTVADANAALVDEKLKASPATEAKSFDILDSAARGTAIASADLVISLLPPALHLLVASDCLRHCRPLLTASYVDDSLRALAPAINEAGILFLCEMGLDPGIDHMSAMQLLHGIGSAGGVVTSFISHCGGLVAPASDDNPWHYKISWNPHNVVFAGKAGAIYRQQNARIETPYEALFAEKCFAEIKGLGRLCWYPNRDSLSYLPTYGLEAVPTFIRTTLRHPDFMSGWGHLVALHLTSEAAQYQSAGRTLKSLFKEHLEKQSFSIPPDKQLLQQLSYLGLDDDETVYPHAQCSPAELLQFALEKNLMLQPSDKDLVVMQHEINYQLDGRFFKHTSTLLLEGENNQQTAMAKTVGLPLGIAAVLILKGVIKTKGLQIPVLPEIYEPVLCELSHYGIGFSNKTEELT